MVSSSKELQLPRLSKISDTRFTARPGRSFEAIP